MTDLKRLKKQRDIYQNQLDAFFNFVAKLCTEETFIDGETYVLAKEKLQKARKVYDLCFDVQCEIEMLVPAAQLNDEQVDRDQFTDKCDLQIAKLITRMDAYEKHMSEKDKQASASSSSSNTNNLNGNLDITSAVKLPHIKLSTFDGSPDKWLEFKDIFCSLIHENKKLQNVQKLIYLKGALIGEPSNVLQSITTTDDNYEVAYRALVDRYDNHNLIKQGNVKAIFELPRITCESASSLRNLVDSVNKNLRCLDSLGEPTSQWDTLLIYIVASKLDNSTHKEWEFKRQKLNNVVFKDLIDFISNRWQVLETISMSRSHNMEVNKSYSNKFKVNTNVAISAERNCVVCNQEHFIFSCPQFRGMSAQERRNASITSSFASTV